MTDALTWSLRDYDAERLGPLFGVSDDGGAAPQIVRAFLDSPKSAVLHRLGLLSLRTVGCCVDAERMSAAGELLVGIDEYEKVRTATDGQVPMTTNVGTVVLPRFYHPMPFITYRADVAAPLEAALTELREEVDAFARPAPLPITVYVAFRGADELDFGAKIGVLRKLAEALANEGFADPAVHRLGLLQRARERDSRAPIYAIDMAAAAGLAGVMIEGDARFEAQDQLFMPGLLMFFEPDRVNEILEHARKRGVSIIPKNQVDVATAARTIWAGLTAAHVMGVHLGKFGLFPLMLEEQVEAMKLVRPWFPGWTPAPAFYVDRPVVTADGVYVERDIVPQAVRWLEGAAAADADVVLIDSPDRTPAPAGSGVREYRADRGRRLLKRSSDDTLGVLTAEDVETIERAASSRSVRILWAGGLDGRQAFELARRKAFGIFTTSTTARRVAVTGSRHDPTLTSALEPTYLGVLGVRMVIEAGFLSAVSGKSTASAIGAAVQPVLSALEQGLLTSATDDPRVPALDNLRVVLEPAWEKWLGRLDRVEL